MGNLLWDFVYPEMKRQILSYLANRPLILWTKLILHVKYFDVYANVIDVMICNLDGY